MWKVSSLIRFRWLLILTFFLPSILHAQGVQYTHKEAGDGGTAVPYPLVTVCTSGAAYTPLPCTPKASIYSDAALTVPLANPFRGDMFGNIEFYATPAAYIISVTAPYSPGYSFKMSASGGFAGTIGNTQVAVGTGINTIGSDGDLIWGATVADPPRKQLTAIGSQGVLRPYNYTSVLNSTWSIDFAGHQADAATASFGAIQQKVISNTNGAVTGQFDFFVEKAGVATDVLTLTGAGATSPNINNTRFVDGTVYTTIQAAINAATSGNATIVIPSNFTITTGLTIAQANITLRCENGATITKGANLDMLTISALGAAVQGCIFEGQQTSFTGGAINLIAGSGSATIENNTFKNLKDSLLAIGVIYITTSSNNKIRNNRFTSINAFGIHGRNNANGNVIEGNYVDTTLSAGLASASAISAHATTAAQSTNDWIITNNEILHGGASFCVEVGDFGGNAALRTIISSNNCKLVFAGSLGGFSLGGTLYNAANSLATVTGNTFDANGFSFTGHAYELYGDHLTVTGNTATTGTQTGANLSVFGCDPCNSSTFSGNIVKATLNGTNQYAYQFITGVASSTMSNNTITGNSADLTGSSSATVRGFAVQCNVPTGTCSNNILTGNTAIGANVAGDTGILLANPGSGTMAGNSVNGNIVTNFNLAYSLTAGVSSSTYEYCGATSGATQACAKTPQGAPVVVWGDVTLNTATSQSITTLPFTDALYSCSGSDLTTAAGIVSFNTYATTSVTIVETGGVNTDHLRWSCVGH